MIYPSYLGIQEKYAYSYEDVLHSIINLTGGGVIPLDVLSVKEMLGVLEYLNNSYTANPYNLSFVQSVEGIYAPTDTSISLLNKLFMRYKHHYVLNLDENLDINSSSFVVYAKEFMQRVVNILDYTYTKYSVLLNFYNQEKENLLDRLGRTRSGNRSVSQTGQNAENSVRIFNDTPQTTDVIATLTENQFASELNRGSVAGSSNSNGSDQFEETENWDTKTMMEKLDEIEKQFSNVWMKWLNEFDELFIEEVNY